MLCCPCCIKSEVYYSHRAAKLISADPAPFCALLYSFKPYCYYYYYCYYSYTKISCYYALLSLEFFIYVILPTALRPWGRLKLKHKWLLEIFPGSKGDRCLGQKTIPLSCANCLEIWEPQSVVILRACPGLYKDCFACYMLLCKSLP
jgi:hypothetical protein